MIDSAKNPLGFERRSGAERRKRKPPFFSKYWLRGRRVKPRRMGDRQRPQEVERYSSNILVFIFLILALSILDAILTLILVGKGAKEINPLMAYYLDQSPTLFFSIKYLLTCASIMLILFCKDFYLFKTKIKAEILFFLIPIPFILVIQWQLRLIIFGS